MNISLSESFLYMAERLSKGHGFWEGGHICYDTAKCKEKKKEWLELADYYAK
ncbi:MAG: hypothetical protein J7M01_02730 [Candidatus Marinimicrobia bacterium]|nr:hypothetical protein [Candidatus Neomarinimicrobiota bacterium]